MNYDHLTTESTWKKFWEEREIYKTEDVSDKPKYYVLDMFPYLSGARLHVGHPRGYIASDVFSRFKRMQGFNVLHPMGFDSFGLPAEQYAIKTGNHPGPYTDELMKDYKEQLESIGFSYDWSREVATHKPEYYKWTQWIFVQLFNSWYNPTTNKAEPIETCLEMLQKQEADWGKKTDLEKQEILMKYRLAYEGYAEVNWCEEMQTVLANDEIVTAADGSMVSERGEYPVVKKSMRQSFMRITAYADRLLTDIEPLDWPSSIKEIQKNWIGKSEGAEIDFEIFFEQEAGLSPALSEGKGAEPRYATANSKNYKALAEKAIEMRDNPTAAEALLWQELKSNNLGLHFRQQHVVDNFIVDFVCLKQKLIIEIDGDIHDSQKERDVERTEILENLGFRIIRFTNDEVLTNISNVLKRVEEECTKVLPLGKDLGWACTDSEKTITVFTTRADTLFGVTYVVLAPEHKLVSELKDSIKNYSEVEEYLKKVKATSEDDRINDKKEKTGICLEGVFAKNPANGELVPVWIADYVLASYGTGAVMAVPAHDERDFEFAKKYDLPMKNVIENDIFPEKPFTEEGIVCNSIGWANGLLSFDAVQEIVSELGYKNAGRSVTKFRMRDAIFARQRYWGEPIPLVYKKDGTIETLPENELPLVLPDLQDFAPAGNGQSPLSKSAEWVEKGYETNTMPGWAGSSWYFLRYMDPHNNNAFASKEAIDYWQDVDMYVGGAEHATGHLLYSRFWHKALFDLGFVTKPEPFKALRNQGMIGGTDGRKMSKRWGNVINPDDVVAQMGADTLRVYESFMGPFESHLPWSTDGIVGSRRFVERVYRFALSEKVVSTGSTTEQALKQLHKTIKKVRGDIDSFSFNTAIASMMICLNEFEKVESVNKKDFALYLQILAPFAPFITEELWNKLGFEGSIHTSNWPNYIEALTIDDEITIGIQINGKVRGDILVGIDEDEESVKQKALSHENVIKWLEGKEPKKVIYVKGRIVSVVV